MQLAMTNILNSIMLQFNSALY